jgi:hypothetical protein
MTAAVRTAHSGVKQHGPSARQPELADLRLPRLLIDTFAAGLTAFLLALQWRWYISVRRDVKLVKKNLLLGVLDRAVLREVDISEFAQLGREKKPEQPKVRQRSL